MHGELRLAPDPDQLVDRLGEAVVLVTHVTCVPATVRRSDARQCDHLFGSGIDPRHVFESGIETQRSRTHIRVDERRHGFDLFRGRLAREVLAHHGETDAAVW